MSGELWSDMNSSRNKAPEACYQNFSYPLALFLAIYVSQLKEALKSVQRVDEPEGQLNWHSLGPENVHEFSSKVA